MNEKKIEILNMSNLIQRNINLLYLLYQASIGFYRNSKDCSFIKLNELLKSSNNEYIEIPYYLPVVSLDIWLEFDELKALAEVSLKLQNFIEIYLGESIYIQFNAIENIFLEFVCSLEDFEDYKNNVIKKIYNLCNEAKQYSNEIQKIFNKDKSLKLKDFTHISPVFKNYSELISQILFNYNEKLDAVNEYFEEFSKLSGFSIKPYDLDDTYTNLTFFVRNILPDMFDCLEKNIFTLKLEEFIETLKYIAKNRVLKNEISFEEKRHNLTWMQLNAKLENQ